MGTKIKLSGDGDIVLKDDRRSVILKARRFIPGADGDEVRVGRDVPVERGERPPPPAAPPPAPLKQRSNPGAPKLPPRVMLVASFVPEEGMLKESWGKAARRTRKLVNFSAMWGDIVDAPPKELAERLAAQRKQVEARMPSDAIRLNVFLTKEDLAEELDLDEVVAKVGRISVPMHGLRVFYIPDPDTRSRK